MSSPGPAKRQRTEAAAAAYPALRAGPGGARPVGTGGAAATGSEVGRFPGWVGPLGGLAEAYTGGEWPGGGDAHALRLPSLADAFAAEAAGDAELAADVAAVTGAPQNTGQASSLER